MHITGPLQHCTLSSFPQRVYFLYLHEQGQITSLLHEQSHSGCTHTRGCKAAPVLPPGATTGVQPLAARLMLVLSACTKPCGMQRGHQLTSVSTRWDARGCGRGAPSWRSGVPAGARGRTGSLGQVGAGGSTGMRSGWRWRCGSRSRSCPGPFCALPCAGPGLSGTSSFLDFCFFIFLESFGSAPASPSVSSLELLSSPFATNVVSVASSLTCRRPGPCPWRHCQFPCLYLPVLRLLGPLVECCSPVILCLAVSAPDAPSSAGTLNQQ